MRAARATVMTSEPHSAGGTDRARGTSRRRFGTTMHRPAVPPDELVPDEPVADELVADEPGSDELVADERPQLPVTADAAERPGQPEPTPSDATTGEPAARSRRATALVVVGLVLALVGVGIAIGVYRDRSSKPSSTQRLPTTAGASPSVPAASPAPSSAPSSNPNPAATAAAPTRAMQGWVEANLSHSAVIVADPVTSTALRAAGFTQTIADTALGKTDWHGVDYLISVPGADTTSETRNVLANSSARLAVFGDETQPVTVSQVFPAGIADLAGRRADNLDARMQAARQLPLNPAVRWMGDTRSIVAAGGVDLRASSVLVVLAQQGTVWVRTISADPNETRAGQPARALTVTVDDPQQVQTILAGLPSLYRPVTVTPISQGTLRLVWSPAVAPVVTAGQ